MDEKNSTKAIEIMSVMCPGDPNGVPTMVYPGQQ